MPLFRSEKKEHYWVYEQLTGQEVSAKYDNWAADYDQQLAQWEYRSPHAIVTVNSFIQQRCWWVFTYLKISSYLFS